MLIDKNTSFKDFLKYSNFFKLDENQLKPLFDQLDSGEHPEFILKKNVPKNLNELTFGQLIQLQLIKTNEDVLFVPPMVILGISKEDVLKCRVFDVIRFMLFVKRELERIAKLFSDIQYKPTQEEIQAGINNINNGIFGTIDWFAKRMGIIDHEYVELIPWVRIYQCAKIDNNNALFERRLRNILTKKK